MTQTATLPPGTPEAEGISSAAIEEFVDAAERHARHLHSLMLLRHGQVVAEGWWDPYGAAHPHMLFSLSKSFTSTAIGLLVAEGKLSVDDAVLQFFPDEAPADPGPNLRAMRVRHLLSMSTGNAEDTLGRMFRTTDANWASSVLHAPVEHEPGTHFVYNSGASYLLSAIVQRVAGMRMLDYLRPRLFEPLRIENPTWELSPQGIDTGGWGLSITTEAIARFGQLYLQQGMWQGRRLLPAAWVEEATSKQVPNGSAPNSDWAQGYGYQFWRCRHGAYRGDGAFGQFCVVMPEQEAVLAITAGLSDMQLVLNHVWEHLLPAFGPAPLPQDRAARQALEQRLGDLRLHPPRGQHSSPIAALVSGKTFTIAPNQDRVEAVTFDFDDEGCTLTFRDERGEQQVRCGSGAWQRGMAAIERPEPWKVAAAGAWTDEETYVARLQWYETPFERTFTCHFNGDGLVVEQRLNVSFGPTEGALLEGRMA